MKRILKGSLLAFLVLGLLLAGCNPDKKTAGSAEVQKYTCPMHPQIIRDAPGTCPICKMDLVPVHSAADHAAADNNLNVLVKPTNEYVISGIKTIRPEKGLRNSEISLKGIINYNTNNWRSISARVSGRIERLYVKYNYEMVGKGQRIMDIYSPDLANAQQELLFLKNNGEPVLLESAKKKLLYLGLSSGQINQVLRTGKVDYTIPVYSPYTGYVAEPQLSSSAGSSSGGLAGGTRISSETSSGMGSMPSAGSAANTPAFPDINTAVALQIREGQYVSAGQKLFNLISTDQVWAEFYARPDQLNDFKRGSQVQVQSVDIPAQQSRVPVSLIQPYFKEGTSYSLIRAVIPNSNKVWKVGQLISVSKATETEGIWLPKTAVLQLGTRYVVFIRRNSAFVPAYVSVNKIAGEWVDIGTSLGSDQELALNAWFLVDSESFIKAERL